MPGIAILKHWKLITIVILALLIGGLFFYYRSTIADLRQERDDLRLEVSTVRANLEAVQRVSKAEKDALIKNLKAERENNDHQRLLRETVAVAGEDRDGPVAPVLSDAIDGLR